MRKFVLSVIIATISLGLWGQKAHAFDDGRHPRSVTLWWVIFNDAGACKSSPGGGGQCGGVDGPDPQRQRRAGLRRDPPQVTAISGFGDRRVAISV